MWASLVFLTSILSISTVSTDTCTATGRFPDHATPACRGYIMCIVKSEGTFTQYNLTCPLDFVFNPDVGVCTDPVNSKCISTDPQYNCNATGHFRDPYSVDCKSFVVCSPYTDGNLVPRIMDCPDGDIFEPVEATCVNATTYTCGEEPKATVADTVASKTNQLYSGSAAMIVFITSLLAFPKI